MHGRLENPLALLDAYHTVVTDKCLSGTLCLDLLRVDLLGDLDRLGDLVQLRSDTGRALVLSTALIHVSQRPERT